MRTYFSWCVGKNLSISRLPQEEKCSFQPRKLSTSPIVKRACICFLEDMLHDCGMNKITVFLLGVICGVVVLGAGMIITPQFSSSLIASVPGGSSCPCPSSTSTSSSTTTSSTSATSSYNGCGEESANPFTCGGECPVFYETCLPIQVWYESPYGGSWVNTCDCVDDPMAGNPPTGETAP